MWTLEMWDGDPRVPKRGDLIQSNVGDRRERTWIILKSIRVKVKVGQWPTFKVWKARWWELEPDMRMRLYRSAERNGGQSVIYTEPIRKPKKKTFEQHMRRIVE